MNSTEQVYLLQIEAHFQVEYVPEPQVLIHALSSVFHIFCLNVKNHYISPWLQNFESIQPRYAYNKNNLNFRVPQNGSEVGVQIMTHFVHLFFTYYYNSQKQQLFYYTILAAPCKHSITNQVHKWMTSKWLQTWSANHWSFQIFAPLLFYYC